MRRRQRGFTLVEVMIALAILALAMTMLVKSTATNITKSQDAFMDGVVTELARGKMYDIEEKLTKDGFQEQTDEDADNFHDEGWDSVHWAYKVEAVELPDLGAMQQMANGAMGGSGSGSGSGSAAGAGSDAGSDVGSEFGGGAFANSALGGMLGMMGGGFSAADAKGGAFIQQQFALVKEVLKASIRKISLTVTWEVMNQPRSMTVIEYVTDPAGMNKVLGGLGSQPISDTTGGGNTSTTSTTSRTSTSRGTR